MQDSKLKDIKTLRVWTLGCSKNNVDTEHLLYYLSDNFSIIPEYELEDKYPAYLIINTCAFIEDAKEESINAILRAVELKKKGSIEHLTIFGCLSQRYTDELPKLIPEVDLWFGARGNFKNIADSLIASLRLQEEFRVGDSREEEGRFLDKKKYSYAYLKISEGCDRRCSYCAIPFIRGAHRSVPIEKLLKEAENLTKRGVKELILIAQDTTYYGIDIYHKRALAELLEKLSLVDGVRWIRIHYSYPMDFPDDVIEQMASNPKICKYIDIPLQHISDRVLANMRRNIKGESIRALIRKIKSKVEGIVIRTTMIVGHPGEGQKEFDELVDFVKEASFGRLGAFKYSQEEGTYGAKYLKDTVALEEKEKRLAQLMEVQAAISLQHNTARIGSIVEVLVDGIDIQEQVLVCRSEFESPEVDGEILVPLKNFANEDLEGLIGEFIKVRIIGASDYDLTGEVI